MLTRNRKDKGGGEDGDKIMRRHSDGNDGGERRGSWRNDDRERFRDFIPDFDDSRSSSDDDDLVGGLRRPGRGPGTADARRRDSADIMKLLGKAADGEDDKSVYQLASEGDAKAISNIVDKIKDTYEKKVEEEKNSSSLMPSVIPVKMNLGALAPPVPGVGAITDFLSGSGEDEETPVAKVLNRLDGDKLSALHYGARFGHLRVVQTLVENGADPNIRGDDGLTPLHHCAKYKVAQAAPGSGSSYRSKPYKNSRPSLENISENGISNILNNDQKGQKGRQRSAYMGDSVIGYLASVGAKVNAKDKYGLSPLHYAAMRGNEEAMVELLKCKEILIECKDDQQLTPLHLACSYGMKKVVKLLLESGASLKSTGEKKQMPLHKACAIGNFSIVEMLTYAAKQIFKREEIEAMVKYPDIDGNTPLSLAVESGNVDSVHLLLDLKADVNQANDNRSYPLHLACTSGNLEIVKLLLHNGAIINVINEKGQTPTMVASAFNQVPVIKYLLKKGAKINKKDKDSFTPLLLAASQGKTEAVETLLKEGADIYAVNNEDRNALYLSAARDSLDTVRAILHDSRSDELLHAGDRRNNTPLHVAAENGFLEVAEALLDSGASVNTKNDEEEAPLHVAGKNGRTRICKEILARDHFAVNDDDSNSNTALHLACSYGHHMAANTLINNGADIESRNYHLWTPLACAAAYGRMTCAKHLLEANASVDPMDKNKTTPLHLAAKYGNDKMAAMLIEYDASLTVVNQDGHNALTIAILHGKRDVAKSILESEGWLHALRSSFQTASNPHQTPLRLLIKQFPELATQAFDRCMITNLQSDARQLNKQNVLRVTPDDPRFTVTMNYELLDDAYSQFQDDNSTVINIRDDDDDEVETPWTGGSKGVYNDKHHLVKGARPYTKSNRLLKENHPLFLMAGDKRTNLLGHPLCMALVRHKWNSFGRYIYFITLFMYFTYVIFLTDYLINTPAPYSAIQILTFGVQKNTSDPDILETVRELLHHHRATGYGSLEACKELSKVIDLERTDLGELAKLIIIVLAATHLIQEFFQLIQAGLSYFGIESMFEWICYVTALLFVYDTSSCHARTGLREDWQWQVGAISITASWLNLLSNVRKLPYMGIYVVMFTDVFRTFLNFSLICVLFLIAFSLGFNALLAEQETFSTFGFSCVKTFVMMIGEFDYGDIFFDNPNDPETQHYALLPYRTTTILLFVIFMMIMSILIMNLLVGLAVDNIKAVQDNAMLERIAMQVKFNLDVERLLPDSIRRRFILKQETLYPNMRTGLLSKLVQDDKLLKMITETVLANRNENEMQKLSSQYDDIKAKLRALTDNFAGMSTEMNSLRSLQTRIAREQGLDDEEE